MFKLNLTENAGSPLSAELANHADIEVVSEAADGILIDCTSTGSSGFEKALATGTPVLLYQPDAVSLAALEQLTGYKPTTPSDLIGIRKLVSSEGSKGYELLDGSELTSATGIAMDDTSPAPATEAASPAPLAERIAQLARRLRAGSAPPVLRAGTNSYTPGIGAKYWHVTNSWGPDTRTLGHTDDVNVRNKLNGSNQQQTPSFMVTADLHIYYTDDPQPSYVIYAKYQATAAAGTRLANTGDARGYFLSKIYMDFQLETSEGTLTPLDHIPRTYDTDSGFIFPLSTAEMQLKVRGDRGISTVTFKPEDSVTFATKGWGIKDESAGNRVKICFHQKDGWNSWVKIRDAFGSWWTDVFGGKWGQNVNSFPDASFSTIVTQAVGAWRLTGKFDGQHNIFMTLRPGDMAFHQEMAFIHNIHSCYGGGNLDNRHHHIYWNDFWAGSAWYLKLSDLPKPPPLT